MRSALLFPGQGAQRPGFLSALPPHPAVARTLDEVSAALGGGVRALDRADALASTVAVQLTLFAAGAAFARALSEAGAEPDAVAGLSLGAFTAAVASGALGLTDAARLVRLRATAMEEAFPEGHGLAAVVGLGEPQVAQLAAEARARAGPVFVANVNAPAQLVLAGARPALEEALRLAREAGARRAELLEVKVPSHCPLLDGVSARLAEALREVPLAAPRIPYVTNVRARLARGAEDVRDDLARNAAVPVRWHDATVLLHELGVRLFVEAPPGHTLSDLAAAAFPEARALAAEGASIAALAARLRRAREG
ncbi:malonate decarboxylase subunit epsilon [Anaeromyxobacter diazotrophicus]|uniref:Malonyl CoA-acyl carrier protein transacylase n=1 Tax=Anaeromyxobacter diazotrophicus TaxID=2590199 RepID=A0A7I9VRG5_9BACT|nr:malonate decarboxylase subunit epsilon [Anaeromyxobacter diazotrophicus]GEJ58838.1 malonyl CoA-acyl carrier protein transacylase [Anaeromyxobacter diazotrophicus]